MIRTTTCLCLLFLLALLGAPLPTAAEETPPANQPVDIAFLPEANSSRPDCAKSDTELIATLLQPEPAPMSCIPCQGPVPLCPDDPTYGEGTCADGCCVYCKPCPCTWWEVCVGGCCYEAPQPPY